MPKISVIIPAYNAELHLQETIDSILSQSFKDFELIIVNHASTDRTLQIIEKYAKIDKRIVINSLSENMGGGKYAADIGYSIAKGEWIIRVDSDDYLSNNSLETLYKKAVNSKSDIVLQKMYCFNNETKEAVKIYSAPNSDLNMTIEGREAVRLTIGKWRIGCNGMLMKKEIIPEYKVPEVPTYLNSCEIDTRIFLINAKKISFCDSNYMYRIHPENSGKKPSVNRTGLLIVDEMLESLLQEKYHTNDVIFNDMTLQKGRHLLGFHLFFLKNIRLFNSVDYFKTIKIINNFYRGINFKLFKGKYSKLISISLRISNFLFNFLISIFKRKYI
jgi:glycosyltransferase involved in cell wall biosynthesis